MKNFKLFFLLGACALATVQSARASATYTNGIFIVNEDWYGHANGSVNFLNENGEMSYRVFAAENPNESLGTTTQYGAVYGDNMYLISKQPASGTFSNSGGRLVVVDAKTLKLKANFKEIGGGDGRAFVGVDVHTGYLGTSSGIYRLNLDNLTLGDVVTGTKPAGSNPYSNQIGTMIRTSNYVLACAQSIGVLVIDPVKHEVIKTIACKNIGTIVQSKDGYVWASAYADGLWKIDPYTLEVVEKITLPANAQIPSSWGAWSASLMCASAHTNTLYWAKMNGTTMTFFGTDIYKYDIDNPQPMEVPFYKLQGAEGKEAFYGAGINCNPLTDDVVVISTKSGYGSNYATNWVRYVDGKTGALKFTKELEEYYWFQAMAVFPDNSLPMVSSALADIEVSEKTTIDLRHLVSDADNATVSVVKRISQLDNDQLFTATIHNDTLTIEPITGAYGRTNLTLEFNSNGKLVTKTIEVAVVQHTTVDIEQPQSLYSIRFDALRNQLFISAPSAGKAVLYNLSGNPVRVIEVAQGENVLSVNDLDRGVYLVKYNDELLKFIKY